MRRTSSIASTREETSGEAVGTPTRWSSLQDRFGVALALFALYVVWGSTYLAIRFTVEVFPPFFMASVRFLVAGSVLFVYLRARGAALPSPAQWLGSAVVAGLLLLGGNGAVSYAEKQVASSLAAMMIATTPLWAALFSGLWGKWPNRLEWVGLGVGFAGVVLLNLEGSLRAKPVGALLLLFAAASWAFGSIWSRSLPLPSGAMASAAEQLSGSLILLLAGLVAGERMPLHVTGRALAALAYLIVFGSLVAFSAYSYLLRRVRPALATSYAYVNPVVAVGLGVGLAGEQISGRGIAALVIILTGVGLVVLGRDRPGR